MSAKYPRSFHLPWSPGGTRDDKRMASVAGLIGTEIVVTEKLDGSNMALTREAVFARSNSGPPSHPSFAWAKALQARIGGQIEPGVTLFGEYCYAVHSIIYEELPGYFFLFGVRDDASGAWWEWDLVTAQAGLLELPTVPELFRGVVESEGALERLVRGVGGGVSVFGGEREGVVARVTRGFGDAEFAGVLGKYVRADHVQTDEHWMFQELRVQRGPRG